MGRMTKLLAGLRYLAFSLVLGVLLLALLEGLAGLALFTREVWRGGRIIAERRHTRYDELLGWANIPGKRIPDMYGPGAALTINAQGFRGVRAYAVEVPPGKTRVICSGDSFTMGYGVGDGMTWPARMEQLAPWLETVNMGQGGYGLDQMFLWYRRDGLRLDHQVHIFAFISGDIGRMAAGDFYGYGKPHLVVEGGRLEVDNYPVPRRLFSTGRILELREAAGVLHLAGWLKKARSGSAGGQSAADTALSSDKMWVVLGLIPAILKELHRLDAARGCRLIAVYLPAEADRNPGPADAIRRRLVGDISLMGIPVIDLIEDFRGLPADAVAPR